MEDKYYDNEKFNVKNQYNEGKSSELEKQEKDLLEKKSDVLRKYFAENVISVLSNGILHVFKNYLKILLMNRIFVYSTILFMLNFIHINIKSRNILSLIN